MQPCVLSDDISIRRRYLSLRNAARRDVCHFVLRVILHESRVVAIRNKTDLLALRLLRSGETERAGNIPRFRLGHLAKRERGALELFLRQLEEKVGLILGKIPPLLENEPARGRIIFHAGIVSGCDSIGADLPGQRYEPCEFELAVTGDAWNRRSPRKIVFDEGPDNSTFKLVLEIDHVERKTQPFGDSTSIVYIVERAATRGRRFAVSAQPAALIPQLHRETDDIVALILQNCGGYRAIDASAHCNCSQHNLCSVFSNGR